MPHNLAHVLYELRRKAGRTDFITEEVITVIRQISRILDVTITVVQSKGRGPTYFVEDNGVRRNFCINPSFEHDLISWTESIAATGTTARDSTQKNSGKESLKLDMTNSGASGQIVSRNLVITGLAATEVWSASVDILPSAFSNSKFVLRLEFLDSGDVVQATHNVDHTTTSSSFVTINNDNRTAPATTTKLRISLILESTAASATGTVHCDGILIEKAVTSGSYFDGDTDADRFWEGVLHASESIYDVDGTAAICGHFMVSA